MAYTLESGTEKELTLGDLVHIYHRRRSIVFGTVIVLCTITASYCLFCTRRYQAVGMVQVQKGSTDAMGLDNLMSSSTTDSPDSLAANMELQTQAKILQSDGLALRTIESLRMEDAKDFRPTWNPIGWVMGLMSPRGVADPAHASLEDSPRRRMHLLNVFDKNLSVKPVTGTRLIEVDYMSSDPRLAAAVVNTLTKALSDYSFQTRYDATNKASKWLREQLGDLRKNSEYLQTKVVDLQRESGVYSLGTTDPAGHEQAYSSVLDKLQQATSAMSAAEQNRIVKEAIAKAAETGDAEMLSGLAGNSMGSATGGVSNSLVVIQNLRQQEAVQQAALQQAEAKFGPAYPKLAELRGNVEGYERSIRQEVNRIKGRAESDYVVAARAESSTRAQYEKAKKNADVLNNKAIEYAMVRQEADQSRGLYEDLLKRLNEAGVLAGLHSSNITIVDQGRVPAKPTKPNVPLYMALALVGGGFLGCCGALLTDILDNKVNSIEEIERLLGEPVIGVLPLVNRRAVLPAQDGRSNHALESRSTYVEAIRTTGTALMLSESDIPPKVLLVTSSIPGEGKSTCASNLAIVAARGAKRTLLIDANLRHGTLSQQMDLSSGPGLSELLSGVTESPGIRAVPGIDNLDLLPAGARPTNPSDLLGSPAMRTWLKTWRTQYDLIVLDSAPVLPVADAVTLNAFVDATLLLVRNRVTEKEQIQRSYRMLRRGGRHSVGIVLNALTPHDTSYSSYYGYRHGAFPYREGTNEIA